jgi:hypothetical protein
MTCRREKDIFNKNTPLIHQEGVILKFKCEGHQPQYLACAIYF